MPHLAWHLSYVFWAILLKLAILPPTSSAFVVIKSAVLI